MMKQEKLKITENKKISDNHYIVEFESKRISQSAKPGQFVQLLLDNLNQPLLPRPFSFLDVNRNRFRILYNVVGIGTRLLSKKKKGEKLLVLGPLGNGFNHIKKKKTLAKRQKIIIIVGGGVGIPPLYHLIKNLLMNKKAKVNAKDIYVFLGARKKSYLHCSKDLKKLKVHLRMSTDDGSYGHKGLITECLDDFLYLNGSLIDEMTIYTCGPTPMLKAVSTLSFKYDVDCQVSVEEPMPCGFGACLGCAIKVHNETTRDNDIDYRYAITCCEGPVFDARDIIWE